MYLEIITPEKKIFQGEVDAVQMPGTEGLFQVLKGHAPIISTLKDGQVKISLRDNHKRYEQLTGEIVHDSSDDKVIRVAIKGGVMEMMNNNIIILAD
ncbi:MAG: F0F1 ATP synthase subunit epsilon [Bacteroidota bacterium]|nr:F0F1 ATP synthase subunit epsilon [Bacteroidota bacterium]